MNVENKGKSYEWMLQIGICEYNKNFEGGILMISFPGAPIQLVQFIFCNDKYPSSSIHLT